MYQQQRIGQGIIINQTCQDIAHHRQQFRYNSKYKDTVSPHPQTGKGKLEPKENDKNKKRRYNKTKIPHK